MNQDLLWELLDAAHIAEDRADLADDLPDDLDELWGLRCELDAILGAARAVKTCVDSEIAVRVGDGGAARLDDYLVRYRPRRTLRVYNPEGLWSWLGDDVARAFNPSYVRISDLRAIARERGHDDPRPVIDCFVDYEYGEPAIDATPLIKAPAYAQGMEHGEIRESRKRKKEAS